MEHEASVKPLPHSVPFGYFCTHPQCPQLPNACRYQNYALDGRVDDGSCIGLFALVSEQCLSLSLILLFLSNVLELVVQVFHPPCQVGDMRSICRGIVRLGFSDDDIQVKANLGMVTRRMVGVAIVWVRGETDIMIACDVRGEGKLALSRRCSVYQEVLISPLLRRDNSEKGSQPRSACASRIHRYSRCLRLLTTTDTLIPMSSSMT